MSDPWATGVWEQEREDICAFFESTHMTPEERAFWDDLWYGLRDMCDGLFDGAWGNDPAAWGRDYDAP